MPGFVQKLQADCVKRQRNLKHLLDSTSTLPSLVDAGLLSELDGSVKQIQQQFTELETRIKDASTQLQVRDVMTFVSRASRC